MGGDWMNLLSFRKFMHRRMVRHLDLGGRFVSSGIWRPYPIIPSCKLRGMEVLVETYS